MNSSTRTTTVGAMRERLIEKAAEDETFRAWSIADPKDAVRDELGVEIPDGFTLEVHEEARTPAIWCCRLPRRSTRPRWRG